MFVLWDYMSNYRLIFLSIVVLIGIGLTGCKSKMQVPPPPEVSAVTIQPQQVVLTTELPGRTYAYRIAEIRPQVNGIILKRLFTEGSDVNEGQVLYEIDPAPFQAAFNNAQASLTRAQASLFSVRSRAERYKELLEDKAVSQQEFDDAESALNQTEADIQYWKAMVETAQINLNYTKVTAPISGRIGRSNVTDGALVTAYQPVALSTIQQLDPIYVDVPQSTAEMLKMNRRLENGDIQNNSQRKVRLFLEDGTEYPLDGTFQFRDVTVDPTTGSVILRMVFPNPDGVLLPGMFTRVLVEEGVQPEAILLPQQAVSRDVKGNPYVFIVNSENKIELRMLTVDREIGNQWLVSSGLAFGERVVVEGLQKVRSGSVVKVVPFNQTKKGIAQDRINGGV
ncbi:MAG: Toluene efflux pump periplasmic linker protein TtgA precursor [Planctomycetes bacterium ADurb.Bin401]|nr:MAG: Toluene efflux pump periplasmic linker protein TtgA precursor [Planctomycetes bacterium ADurb.Bin401]